MRCFSRDARLLLVEIALPLLLLGAFDVGFGWYAARNPTVPLPRLFAADPVTTGKFLALRERALHPPAVDVLLLGMSQMMRINGEQLEAELSEQARRQVRVFNLAGPYHAVGSDQRLVRDLVLPLAKPRVIVYGLTPLALVNEILTVEQIDAHYDVQPIFGLYSSSRLARLRAHALMHLNLWKYREVMHDALQVPFGWKHMALGEQARAATPLGDVPLLTRHIDVLGLNRAELRNRPRFKDFDAVLSSTLLFGHLARFARFCRQHGIELVLLNNPVHPFFMQLLPHGERDYRRCLARLREVAAELGVRLFEPERDGVGPPEFFNDTVHLDPAGGSWLTRELARALVDAGLVKSE